MTTHYSDRTKILPELRITSWSAYSGAFHPTAEGQAAIAAVAQMPCLRNLASVRTAVAKLHRASSAAFAIAGIKSVSTNLSVSAITFPFSPQIFVTSKSRLPELQDSPSLNSRLTLSPTLYR